MANKNNNLPGRPEGAGVEGAIKKLGSGQELGGLAHAAEVEARAEYETKGPLELLLKDATRHQAAADVCWDALNKAAQDGDLQLLGQDGDEHGDAPRPRVVLPGRRHEFQSPMVKGDEDVAVTNTPEEGLVKLPVDAVEDKPLFL